MFPNDIVESCVSDRQRTRSLVADAARQPCSIISFTSEYVFWWEREGSSVFSAYSAVNFFIRGERCASTPTCLSPVIFMPGIRAVWRGRSQERYWIHFWRIRGCHEPAESRSRLGSGGHVCAPHCQRSFARHLRGTASRNLVHVVDPEP